MLLSRKLDDKEIQLKNQSQIFFQISGAGHEAVLAAAGLTLRPGYDWFFPYYRDRALCLQLGVTPLEMLLAAVGAEGRSRIRRTPDAVALGSHDIQHRVGLEPDRHAGAACRRLRGGRRHLQPRPADSGSRVAVQRRRAYLRLARRGRHERRRILGSAQHHVHQAAAGALLVEDNGYAISVPVEVQTAGGDISRLVRSFPGLHVDSIDGTDFFGSLRAMREATAYVRARKGPAFVHARGIRPYSHSLSDDERLYKPPAEREAEAKRDPILRFTEFLKKNGFADRRGSGGTHRRRRARGERGGAAGAGRAEAGEEHRRAVAVFAGCRSGFVRVRDAGASRRQARHDGVGDQPHAEGRDGARRADRRSSAKTSRT